MLCMMHGHVFVRIIDVSFIHFRDEDDAVQEITSMPGQARYGINKLRDALKPLVEKGLKTVLIFGVPGNIIKVF